MTRSIITTLAAAVIGALLVITTFAFGGSAEAWISFGLAVLGLGTAVAAHSSRALAGVLGLVSAWTILVALGIFGGATQTWLIFAGGVAIAVAGLIANARADRRAALVAVPASRAA